MSLIPSSQFKWLPIFYDALILLIFLALFFRFGRAYEKPFESLDKEAMLKCFDFFTTFGYITLVVSIALSFFILDRRIKVISIFIGILVLIIVVWKVGSFNPN